jgi:hypothetical protein
VVLTPREWWTWRVQVCKPVVLGARPTKAEELRACKPVVRVQESKASLEEARACRPGEPGAQVSRASLEEARACRPEELAVLRMKASVAE